jgi:excisionase family DNA binding protein
VLSKKPSNVAYAALHRRGDFLESIELRKIRHRSRHYFAGLRHMTTKPDHASISPSTKWLTPDEAAAYLRISRGSLRNLVLAGTIPAPKALSKRILRYDRQALDEALGGKSKDEERGPRLGDIDWGPSREERKRLWLEEKSTKPSANRPWLERERREREERKKARQGD